MLITIVLLLIFVAIILFIAIYAWLNIKVRAMRKITYEQAWDYEVKQIKKHHLAWEIKPNNFQKVYKVLSTRYGDVNLFKFGNSSRVVIFVHGIMSNYQSVIKILDYFLSRNFSVIAYDNFGWGKSRHFGTTKFGRNEALLLQDIVGFTKKNLDVTNLTIYGESMGGATVYNYLHLFGNNQTNKYIVNAGYISLLDNVMHLGKKQLWYFVYMAYVPLLAIFWLQRWPIKKFISKNNLQQISNIYHLHSIDDKLVSYNHIRKYLPSIHYHYIYQNSHVRHVFGWYEATQEHYQILDKWLKE